MPAWTKCSVDPGLMVWNRKKMQLFDLRHEQPDETVSYWKSSGKYESRNVKSTEWKTGISCPDLRITSKHLQTVMRAAALGQIFSMVGVKGKGSCTTHHHAACVSVCVHVCVFCKIRDVRGPSCRLISDPHKDSHTQFTILVIMVACSNIPEHWWSKKETFSSANFSLVQLVSS